MNADKYQKIETRQDSLLLCNILFILIIYTFIGIRTSDLGLFEIRSKENMR